MQASQTGLAARPATKLVTCWLNVTNLAPDESHS
jgi:hypothetical protein